MKSRAEIKYVARSAMHSRYWACVIAPILTGMVIIGCTPLSAGLAGIILTGPLTAGLNYFFVQVFQGRGYRVNVGTPFSVAFTDFGRKLGGFLWQGLFIWLWSLLFVIPGVIKTFSYAMTMYVLSDCPNVRAQDALTLSKRMMRGHKWQLFVFQLSFIGWEILSSLTLGILQIFYVAPYYSTAMAGFYLEVREEALRTGVITLAQLNGQPLD